MKKLNPRAAITVGMWISWGVSIPIIILGAQIPTLELKIAMYGIAASLVGTGFSQFGILLQMK